MNKFIVLALMLIASTTNAFAQKSTQEINREYGQEFRKIGTDPTLSGYEKGRKKRALSLKKKQEYTSNNHDYHYKDKRKKEIENRIDELEKRYDRDKDRIKDNDNLSKNEKKAQQRTLEQKFKAQKNALKIEKDNIK